MAIARLIGATAAAAAVLLTAPVGAAAATTCDLSSGVLEVSLGANSDAVRMFTSAGAINMTNRNGVLLGCTGGAPTVNNTNSISIHNSAGQTNNDVTITDVASYVPGSIAEAGDDEIEIFVNLNDSSSSEFLITTDEIGGHVEIGTGGINPNAEPGEDQPDTDIIHNNTSQRLVVNGDTATDVIGAQGGPGSGGPVTRQVEIYGGGGNDVLSGGNGPDLLVGEGGADEVHGFGGDDHIEGSLGSNTSLTGGAGEDNMLPGSGTDPVDGGPDLDTVHYAHIGAGVSVTLEGTNVETLNGTQFADVLRGDDGPNEINGFDGGDEIDGGGGADTINAGTGSDSLQVRDGVADTGTCGPDVDTATVDVLGVDLINDCESVIFPPPPTAPDPGGGGPAAGAPDAGNPGAGNPGAGNPGAGPSDGGQVVAGFGARTLVAVTLPSGRIPGRGPLPVRVVNSNGFTVNGTLGGETTNRLRAAGRKRRVRLRAKTFTVPANARRTIRLKLPSRLRRELARKRKLSLRLTARVRDPGGNARSVRKIVKPRLRRR
jgi:Ca2+-binding RTX toxin-like protein